MKYTLRMDDVAHLVFPFVWTSSCESGHLLLNAPVSVPISATARILNIRVPEESCGLHDIIALWWAISVTLDVSFSCFFCFFFQVLILRDHSLGTMARRQHPSEP
ncbi:hypothetical protein BS47DRAFT_192774 [Hydnum rufescens UP504]|uniref:Uncharacterized protein n=1 Tax=Hydnum rufescens UP504 TaxID=1448309 RepID=A0A9P6B6P0_9AGAM|nr:hypothetical protein BS47DRAFT_192774 [Hydnum rufescens UP504]